MATVLITDHASLKTAVASWLNRSDLTDEIGNFIQNAEDQLRLDPRVRNLARTTFSISADGIAVPSGFDELDSWTYQGGTHFGEIDIVEPGELGELLGRYGTTGVPRWAARVDGNFYFAPAPSGTYETIMTYWQTLPDLTAGANWLITAHPKIYLYAALAESAPFLKDDNRIAVWETKLEQLLFNLGVEVEDQRFGGNLVRRPSTVIGG